MVHYGQVWSIKINDTLNLSLNWPYLGEVDLIRSKENLYACIEKYLPWQYPEA